MYDMNAKWFLYTPNYTVKLYNVVRGLDVENHCVKGVVITEFGMYSLYTENVVRRTNTKCETAFD